MGRYQLQIKNFGFKTFYTILQIVFVSNLEVKIGIYIHIHSYVYLLTLLI